MARISPRWAQGPRFSRSQWRARHEAVMGRILIAGRDAQSRRQFITFTMD